MYIRCLFLVLTFLTVKAFSQTEETAVKQTVNRLFDGMRRSDSGLIRSAFSPKAIIQTVVKNKEGNTVVHSEEADRFITAVTQPHNEVYDERITFDIVRIDGDLAIAWTPYKFYLGEKFSHCGVNSFQLVKLNGEWKIQYIIDTRRKESCP